jgi:hypothetical protein
MREKLFQTHPRHGLRVWQRKNLIDIKKKESLLEDALVATPELLCLEDLGIFHNHIHVVRQASARAITGAQTYPDILFLTDTGEVGIVEVKRYGNPELAGRKVISQVLDYGATLTTLSEPEQVKLFRNEGSNAESFEQLVVELYRKATKPAALASKIRRQLQYGQLYYMIACDRAPIGLGEWVRSVSQSSTTDFTIRVLEVCPYQQNGEPDTLIWFSAPIIETETIQRTTIRIDTPKDDSRVVVHIEGEISEDGKSALGMNDPRSISTYMAIATEKLANIQSTLGYNEPDLFSALERIHRKALHKEWGALFEDFIDEETKDLCYLRGTRKTGLAEGRFGVNWLSPWKPGFCAGYYFSDRDHRAAPVGDDGSFAIILDVKKAWGESVGLYTSEEFLALEKRLSQVNDWTLRRAENDWHPLILARCMKESFKNVGSPAGLEKRWFELAEEGLGLMLEGGELGRFKQRVSQDA